MRFRLAKLCDADQLADVHSICCSEQPEGFMFKLGKSFLRKYYQILLNERNSVVIVAESEAEKIIGFYSGSSRSEEHIEKLRQNKLSLILASVRAILRNPCLLKSMYIRYKSTKNKGEFIITNGPRMEYWACLPSDRNSGAAIELHKLWYEFMRLLGVTTVKGEINEANKRTLKMHQIMGATIIKEFETPEGNKRYIIEYILDKKQSFL